MKWILNSAKANHTTQTLPNPVFAVRQAQTWLPGCAPQNILILGVIVYLAAALLGSYLVREPYWLGLEFKVREGHEGLAAYPVPGSPAEGRVVAGEIFVAIMDADGLRHHLGPYAVLDDPDHLASYTEYRAFFDYQAGLARISDSSLYKLVRSDGSFVTIYPTTSRPVSSFPLNYWLQNVFGLTSLLIGLGVWSYRRGQCISRLVVLGGCGLALAISALSTYGSRELFFDLDCMRTLTFLNQAGNTVYAYSIFTAFWYFPKRLGAANLAIVGFLVSVAITINQAFFQIDYPLHSFFLPSFLVPFFGICLLAIYQWRRTQTSPVERASLLWWLLTTLIPTGTALALFVTPILLGAPSIVRAWQVQFVMLCVFLGLVLGILRYRLFDLERWWFTSWAWFFGGVSVLLIDVALIYLLNLNPFGALSLSIIIAGWLYFPARQWVWGRIYGSSKTGGLESYIPDLMEYYFLTVTKRDVEINWSGMLSNIFSPLRWETRVEKIDQPLLDQYGLALRVPSLDGLSAVVLSGKHRGARLFSKSDIELVDGLIKLSRRFLTLRTISEGYVQVERERILRDLHDDVGAKLLTLMYDAEDQKTVDNAKSALKSLKETIYVMRDNEAIPLQNALEDWELETRYRISHTTKTLEWIMSQDMAELSLTGRQRVNLGKIFREAISNAIQNESSENICVTVALSDRRLCIKVHNDGVSNGPETWILGAGVSNIKVRAQEIDASVNWVEVEDDQGEISAITFIVEVTL